MLIPSMKETFCADCRIIEVFTVYRGTCSTFCTQ
nr:MAG TPA: hypothetical protein [Caudoviricetes sp.]